MGGKGSGRKGHHEEARGYAQLHVQLRNVRGPARRHPCTSCPRTASHWAYDHADDDERWGVTDVQGQLRPVVYSVNLWRYIPLCLSCHRMFDKLNRPATTCEVSDCERTVTTTLGLCRAHYDAAWTKPIIN